MKTNPFVLIASGALTQPAQCVAKHIRLDREVWAIPHDGELLLFTDRACTEESYVQTVSDWSAAHQAARDWFADLLSER